MIPVTCPQCSARMLVEDRFAGGTWTCGQCQTLLSVPEAAADPRAIPAVQPAAYNGPVGTSGKAIASLVLGVLSIIGGCTFLTGLPGILLGHLAKSDIAIARGQLSGKGIATWGLVLSYTGTGLFFLLFLPSLLYPLYGRGWESVYRVNCMNNLKQMGLVAKIYANENQGKYFPPLSSESGRLMMSAGAIYPGVLTDPTILICPSHPHADELRQISDPLDMIGDHSYFYLGYVVTSDEEVAAFAEVYRQRMAEGLPFDEDIQVAPGTGSAGGDAILRLRERLEPHLGDGTGNVNGTMWQSRIPILIEPPDNHHPAGANVLYMDGHVEFIRYPGKWPMTETTMNTLMELAKR